MRKYNLDTVRQLEEVYYGEGTYAFYDAETDTYYNAFGEELRHKSAFNKNSEGYTPFGDEGFFD